MSNPKEGPLTFRMYRTNDESGVSGTGWVLEGVQFHNGKVSVCWLSEHESVGLYDSLEDFVAVHITSHPSNGTVLRWSNGVEMKF